MPKRPAISLSESKAQLRDAELARAEERIAKLLAAAPSQKKMVVKSPPSLQMPSLTTRKKTHLEEMSELYGKKNPIAEESRGKPGTPVLAKDYWESDDYYHYPKEYPRGVVPNWAKIDHDDERGFHEPNEDGFYTPRSSKGGRMKSRRRRGSRRSKSKSKRRRTMRRR